MADRKGFTQDFLKDTAFTLIAFCVFHIAIVKHVKKESNTVTNIVYNNFIYMGGVKVIAALLAGKDITTQGFIKEVSLTVVAFCVYDVFTKDIVSRQPMIKGKLNMGIAQDFALFGGLFVIYQVFQGGSLLDEKWLKSSIASFGGLVVSNMFFL